MTLSERLVEHTPARWNRSSEIPQITRRSTYVHQRVAFFRGFVNCWCFMDVCFTRP